MRTKRQWVHDQLRERLLSKSSWLMDLTNECTATFSELLGSEWSPEFERLMRNRLVMGALRYGRIQDNRGKKYLRVKDAIRRLNEYEEGGNLEHLVDAANLILLEFECGAHPKKHFNSVDDGQHCEVAV